MIEIKFIDAAHKDDINIPNEPFQLIGRMIPSYSDEQWSYSICYFNSELPKKLTLNKLALIGEAEKSP